MQEFLLHNLFWLFLATASFTGLVWTFVRGGKINLSPQAAILAVSRGGGLFLDIRSAAEFSGGHIPRSQNIPSSELPARTAAISKFKKSPVVVVCPNGHQARKTVRQLADGGFSNVHILSGGIAAWRDANLPLFSKKAQKKK